MSLICRKKKKISEILILFKMQRFRENNLQKILLHSTTGGKLIDVENFIPTGDVGSEI